MKGDEQKRDRWLRIETKTKNVLAAIRRAYRDDRENVP